jgi:YbgC/YbaW family acyl-CoA thioester hydrolase
VPSEHRLRRRVQFYETDLAGIVHFSWFFRYMEEAEHALWREAGLSIAKAGEEQGFPRLAAHCDFHAPLRFEDEFEVWIRVAAVGRRTMRYSFLMTRGETRIASGTTTIACVSKRPGEPMKAIDIPVDVARRFQVAESAEEPVARAAID